MSDALDESVQGRADRSLVQNPGHSVPGKATAEQLHEELETMLATATELSFDGDKLSCLLDDLRKVDPLPGDSDAFDPDAGLTRFHAHLASASVDEDTSSAETSFISSQPNSPKRRLSSFSVLAAVLVLLFAATSVASAFHWNIIDRIAHWSQDIFHYEDPETASEGAQILCNPLEEGEVLYYDSVDALMKDFGITAPVFPTWVPERMGEPSIKASNKDFGICFFIGFISNNDFLSIRCNQVFAADSRDIEKNQSNAELFTCNGNRYYLLSDNKAEKAVWQNGTLECQMWGTISREEIKQILSSIR